MICNRPLGLAVRKKVVICNRPLGLAVRKKVVIQSRTVKETKENKIVNITIQSSWITGEVTVSSQQDKCIG